MREKDGRDKRNEDVMLIESVCVVLCHEINEFVIDF
jgi:hypothetical protein